MSKKSLSTEILELFYDCCYGKPKVEIGYPANFESSKVNVTYFERALPKLVKKYKITEVGGGSNK